MAYRPIYGHGTTASTVSDANFLDVRAYSRIVARIFGRGLRIGSNPLPLWLRKPDVVL
jgi:hypothetical protein